MENTETPKDSNKLSWRDYLLIAGIIAVFYFFDNDHQDILNYPDYLMYWLVAAIAITRWQLMIGVALVTGLNPTPHGTS